jgi:uroporphyrinogen-III synthase
MSLRVLVTRAEPGASETAERLKALGHEPVVEPMFAIEPMPAALPAFDALAFTSANGVRVFARLSERRDVPVFCVGGRTTEAARDAGFANAVSADGDVAALIDLIESRTLTGARLLHSGNETSRGDLAGTLTARGRTAAFVPTYRAVPIQRPGPALAAHLEGRASFNAVLAHSPRGAEILAGFLAQSANRARFSLAAMSSAAAAPLAAFAECIEIATTPDEAALLAALARLPVSG